MAVQTIRGLTPATNFQRNSVVPVSPTSGPDVKTTGQQIVDMVNTRTVSQHDTSATLTGAEIIGGVVISNPSNGSQTLTFPTTNNLYTSMGSPPINTSINCKIVNTSSAFSLAIANSDMSITGVTNLVISPGESFDLLFVVTGLVPTVISVSGGVNLTTYAPINSPSFTTSMILNWANAFSIPFLNSSKQVITDSQFIYSAVTHTMTLIHMIASDITSSAATLAVRSPISYGALSATHNTSATLTGTEIVNGVILMNPASGQSMTLPAAADIYTAMGSPVAPGSVNIAVSCKFVNLSNNSVSLAKTDVNLLISGLVSTVIQPQQTVTLSFIVTDFILPQVTIYGGSGVILSQTLTDASTINWNMNNGPVATVTLAGNRTLGLPTNITAGQTYKLIINQDATGNRTITFNAAFIFPINTPTLNSVPNSYDIFQFLAIDNATLLLVDYSSSVFNWNLYDGSKNTLPFSINQSNSATGFHLVRLDLTRILFGFVVSSGAVLKAIIITVDSLGRMSIGSATTIDTSVTMSSANCGCSIAVLSSTQAVISYKKVITAVACLNICGIGISGTTITAGTPTQLRATEIVDLSNGQSVNLLSASASLTSTTFGIAFRTFVSHILYCYLGTIDGSNNLTFGGSPLIIENGTTDVVSSKMFSLTSTTALLVFQSTAAGTVNYLRAGIITFSATDPTSIGTLATITTSLSNNCMDVDIINASNWLVVWADTVGSLAVKAAVINNNAGSLAVGTPISFPNLGAAYSPNQLINVCCPDVSHGVVCYQTSSASDFLTAIVGINGSTLNLISQSKLNVPTVTDGCSSIVSFNNMAIFGASDSNTRSWSYLLKPQ